MAIGHFLGGIGALIWDQETGEYLLLRRAASKDFKNGEWECVTGRVDQGESYTQALAREVREEIGVHVRPEFIVGLTHFYRGEALPENELLGVIFGCTISERSAVQIGEEHSEMAWMRVEQISQLLDPKHWLLQSIERAERLRAALPDSLRRELHRDGLEI